MFRKLLDGLGIKNPDEKGRETIDVKEITRSAEDYIRLLLEEAKRQLGRQSEKTITEIPLRTNQPILIKKQTLYPDGSKFMYDWYLIFPVGKSSTVFALHSQDKNKVHFTEEQRGVFLAQFGGIQPPLLIERLHNRARDQGLTQVELTEFNELDALSAEDFFRFFTGKEMNSEAGECLIQVGIGESSKKKSPQPLTNPLVGNLARSKA